jgi:hypothetical protein
MFDFRVPLRVMSAFYQLSVRTNATLALTLSNDGGLTIEKHMRKTSV